jgi:hypothetical protein
MKGNQMQLRYFLLAAAATLLAGLTPSARADSVLYSDAGFIEGNQAFVQPLDITQAGTLTISLSNVPWLDTISDLSFFVTTSSGVVGGWQSDGTESMRVAPGMIYTHWFGEADGKYGVGAYSLKIMFQPGTVSAVPLPGSLTLLLSVIGLGVVARWRRLAGSAVALVWAWSLPSGGAEDLAAMA